MWLDKLHSFVKAGKVFNHSVFLTLYHSCCTPYKCEYLHQWPLLFFYVPYISLIFTHLAHCPWVSSLSTDEGVVSVWMNCRQTQLLLFVEAVPQAESSAHGRAQCVRLDLGQAVLAPISKIQFCTTLLRLQLPFFSWLIYHNWTVDINFSSLCVTLYEAIFIWWTVWCGLSTVFVEVKIMFARI